MEWVLIHLPAFLCLYHYKIVSLNLTLTNSDISSSSSSSTSFRATQVQKNFKATDILVIFINIYINIIIDIISMFSNTFYFLMSSDFIRTYCKLTYQSDGLSSSNHVCPEKVVESQNISDRTFHISNANL